MIILVILKLLGLIGPAPQMRIWMHHDMVYWTREINGRFVCGTVTKEEWER